LFTWDSSQASNPQNVRVVSDKDGNNYVAIKLNQAFRRIRVKSSSTALLGLASKEYKLDVYHAFYYVADPCDIQPAFTSFDGSGLTLDVLGLNRQVQSLNLAIDDDLEGTSSEISLGIVGLAGSMEQMIYFNS